MKSTLPFVVASLSRSGSSMLVTALDDHPRVVCYSEVFNINSYSKLHAQFGSASNFLKYCVWYEDLLDNFQQQMKRLFNFLRIQSHKVRPATSKQETRSLSQVIINYNEVIESLAKNGYSSFIDHKIENSIEDRPTGPSDSDENNVSRIPTTLTKIDIPIMSNTIKF